MPLPKPQMGEDRNKFVSRCMADSNARMEFPEQKQRLGYCEGAFEMNTETNEFVNISDMEVFKEGTHNGHTFNSQDIDEIVNNYNELKGQLTPKVKISHGKKQESIAGLASYGDVTKVVAKTVDGIRKIFVDLADVPDKVAQWIKDKRFAERSVEIFPIVKINGKAFKNVLAKVALLGHQIPAVAGMSPIDVKLSIESDVEDDNEVYHSEHFEYKLEEKENIINFTTFERKDNMADQKMLDEMADLKEKLSSMEGKLDSAEGKKMYEELSDKLIAFEKRVTDSEAGKEKAEKDLAILAKDIEDKEEKIKAFEKEKVDAEMALKDEKISNFISDLKQNGKITPAVEKELSTLLCSLDDSEKTLEFTTKTEGGDMIQQKASQLEIAKRILSRLSTVVEFGELLSDESSYTQSKESDAVIEVHGTKYELDGLEEEKAIEKLMKAKPEMSFAEATRTILDAKEKEKA